MRFFRSIKWRATTYFLLIFLFILCLVVGFSYFLLAQAVYSNEAAPINAYTTTTDIPNSIPGNTTAPVNNDFQKLNGYTISGKRLDAIRSGSQSELQIQIQSGTLTIDQRNFISSEAQGDQKVWVYYRVSPANTTKYEIMVMVRPASETRLLLGQFTNILILILPFTLLLAFLTGYLLLKRLLQPIKTITAKVQEINNNNSRGKIDLSPDAELGELTASLNQAFGQLQETIDRERQAIADTSHELRTPLTVLQGEATLALRKKRTAEEYEKHLKTIQAESTYLASLLNKLMMLVKLENNPNALIINEVDLTKLLENLAVSAKLLCEQNGLTFDAQIAGNAKIPGDEIKLRELFYNLLENAVKYNQNGGQVSLSLNNDANGNAVIRVCDTGIGIKTEYLSRIFDRFYRVDKTSSPKDGLGLGLYICEKIVELHNGRIEVESDFGKGTVFTVYLPLDRRI
ncbi:MAG TPA: HAMP domain-containing sensor histidine kinase [Dehalococcoidales bacterium]|nr:HAMP domain-containing sensor histidine kinase [Dehalococcoidales bacterium]